MSAEVAPYSASGPVADVVGALAGGLARLGHQVTVLAPAYGWLRCDQHCLIESPVRVDVHTAERRESARFYQTWASVVPHLFVRGSGYFDRPGLYGDEEGPYVDNVERFAFFAKAVIGFLEQTPVDVIGCHEWVGALIPLHIHGAHGWARERSRPATVLSVHDLSAQGRFERAVAHSLGLPPSSLGPDGVEADGGFNLLRAGLARADRIVLPSPGYAAELQEDEAEFGLEAVLRSRRDAVSGILATIPGGDWDPAHDPYLKARYDREELVGKRSCKLDLQSEMDVARDVDTLVLAVTGRLDDEHGLDLVIEALPELLEGGGQLLVVGDGERRYQDALVELRRRFPLQLGWVPGGQDIRLRKLLAGADVLLLPRRRETLGIDALRAMRYGAIPVARAVGALHDVVLDVDGGDGRPGTGFKFEAATPAALIAAVRRAAESFRTRPEAWRAIVANAMAHDLTSSQVAQGYERCFRSALQARWAGEEKTAADRVTGRRSRRSGRG